MKFKNSQKCLILVMILIFFNIQFQKLQQETFWGNFQTLYYYKNSLIPAEPLKREFLTLLLPIFRSERTNGFHQITDWRIRTRI